MRHAEFLGINKGQESSRLKLICPLGSLYELTIPHLKSEVGPYLVTIIRHNFTIPGTQFKPKLETNETEKGRTFPLSCLGY
jgi:hypothetical protein